VADFVVLHQLVDRILQEQKAKRQATEKAKLDETEKAEREEAEKVRSETSALFISSLPEMTLHYTQTKIPITQTNIPLPPADTVIPSLSPLATHGTTGVEQAPKRSRLTSATHELVNFLYRNSPDAASSRSTSPSTSPPPSRSTSPSLPGAFMLEQPGPSRELVRSQPDHTVTSLSSIGMSLETNISGKISGCHLMLHCI
jgi:hypothetical protein